MALQFVIHEKDTDTKDDINIYIKGTRLINLLTQWTKSLSRAIAKQRQMHGIKMSNKIATTADPYEFLESPQVFKQLCTAKESLKQAIYSRKDMLLVTGYAAAVIVYKNGQRYSCG